jgi:predicted metal-dependent phosphoesterase TrpH
MIQTRPYSLSLSGAFLLILVSGIFSNAHADISVTVGPTTIPRGDATGDRDITINNGLFAVAFAVDTAPPWGVARGGIVDIAIVKSGKPGFDIASLVDFMPNIWSSWPTTYQRVSIKKQSSDEVIVLTTRDWGSVNLETTFHIRDGDSKIHIVTRMTNKGDELLEGLMSGYVVWPDGGFLFGVPGLSGVEYSEEADALADWSAAYDEDWVLGLHAPFAEYVAYDGRDRYQRHDLPAGASRSFEAWLQIENEGALAPLVQTEINYRQSGSGHVAGRVVSDAGEPVDKPVVVVLKRGKPYSWSVGSDGIYEMTLPAGQYDLYATARGYAKSSTKTITVADGSETKLDFNNAPPPGLVSFEVLNKKTRQPLDARISIREGYTALTRYLGTNTFFTELDDVGKLTASIAPGDYVFEISAGGGFTSKPQSIELSVSSGQKHEVKSEIGVRVTPSEFGWYGADLHHHSDVLDGFTKAEYVLRSELAAGVDIAFLSDHDSVTNNAQMKILSNARGMKFIPGTELSPSWAHFNAYPLDDGKTVDIDTGQATVQEVFAYAREMGADIIAVNHPYSEYGYFESLEKTLVPGGHDTGFDLVEITSWDNTKTLKRVWQMWNEGQKAYLAAGSDAHDVWVEESGAARSYVRVKGDLSIAKFVAALKNGHAYASQGPLVVPDIVFGSEVHNPPGDELALEYSIMAVSGLRSVQLIERGEEVDSQTFDGKSEFVRVRFSVKPGSNTWYSLVIEDEHGKFAYTNPIWVVDTK